MRRTLAIATLTALSLAACGGSDSSEPVDEADGAEQSASTDDAPDVDAEVGDTVPSDADQSDGAATDEPLDPGPPPTNPDTPEVEIPAELPTELVRTVLDPGTGDEAAAGDTVIVDYIGVRSSDGVEFDSSYEREPFPVTLGSGGVIQGWDDGLIGSQTGERVQLDIPPDLAYGPSARGDIIGENESLTFVIDVRVVVKSVDAADVPTEPGVELSETPAPDTVFEDLTVGEGELLAIGDTAVIRYVNFRGDEGTAIETNWGADPIQIPYGENLLPGLLEGMEGMMVGGRRAITIPPEDGFGPDGNPAGGLPANTDMIFLIDLLGTY